MEDGSIGDDINPWGVAMFLTLQDVELDSFEPGVGLRPVAGRDLDSGRRPGSSASTARPA